MMVDVEDLMRQNEDVAKGKMIAEAGMSSDLIFSYEVIAE